MMTRMVRRQGEEGLVGKTVCVVKEIRMSYTRIYKEGKESREFRKKLL